MTSRGINLRKTTFQVRISTPYPHLLETLFCTIIAAHRKKSYFINTVPRSSFLVLSANADAEVRTM